MPYIKASRQIKTNRLFIWSLISDFDCYEAIRPGIKKVNRLNAHTQTSTFQFTDLDGRQWNENLISWNEPYEYTLAVDIATYPYPLSKLFTTMNVNASENGSTLAITMDYQVKYGFLGKLLDLVSIKHALNQTITSMLDNSERLASSETLKGL